MSKIRKPCIWHQKCSPSKGFLEPRPRAQNLVSVLKTIVFYSIYGSRPRAQNLFFRAKAAGTKFAIQKHAVGGGMEKHVLCPVLTLLRGPHETQKQ